MPEFPNPLSIGLGTGRIAISVFHDRHGSHGLIFRDSGAIHAIGEAVNDVDEPEHMPIEGEVYIACMNRESALVLQDMANRVVESFERPPETTIDSASTQG